jgi:hypothetical protein
MENNQDWYVQTMQLTKQQKNQQVNYSSNRAYTS